MARSKRYEKNLSKVQSMVDGTYGWKVQSGYDGKGIHENRKIGERYFDYDDKEWEKTEYGRTSISRTPGLGIGDQCSDCEKLISKKWLPSSISMRVSIKML